MPRSVQLPDGRTLVIPDDASPDQLAALRNKLGARYADPRTGRGMEQRAQEQSRQRLKERVQPNYAMAVATGDDPNIQLRSMQPGLPSAFQDPNTANVAATLSLIPGIAETGGLLNLGRGLAGSLAGGAAGRYIGGAWGPRGAQTGAVLGGLAGGMYGGITGKSVPGGRISLLERVLRSGGGTEAGAAGAEPISTGAPTIQDEGRIIKPTGSASEMDEARLAERVRRLQPTSEEVARARKAGMQSAGRAVQ